MLPVTIFDQFDPLVALSRTPFVAEELFDGLGFSRASNDQHRVGLLAGHHKVVELVSLNGLYERQIPLQRSTHQIATQRKLRIPHPLIELLEPVQTRPKRIERRQITAHFRQAEIGRQHAGVSRQAG